MWDHHWNTTAYQELQLKQPFLLPAVIGCQYGLSSGWEYIILSSTHTRISWQQECLDLIQLLYQSHSHCKCMSTMPVHILEILSPTVFPSPLPSHRSLMERYVIDVPFRARHSTPFFPAELSTPHQLFPVFWIVVTLFINLHSLHKETSLMRFESCTNLQMQRCIFRQTFNIISVLE